MQTSPLNVTLQPHNWEVWLVSKLKDRDNLSKEDKSSAPNVFAIQRFRCNEVLATSFQVTMYQWKAVGM